MGYGSEVSRSQIDCELDSWIEQESKEFPQQFLDELEGKNAFWVAPWEHSPEVDQDDDSLVIW